MGKNWGLRFVCITLVVFALAISPALAQAPPPPTNAVNSLIQIFGTPESFLTSFDNNVTEKANGVIGLLVAAFGFSLVLRSFL